MMLLGETAVLGAFLAQDLLLFVLFFDLMLVPFYFLFGAWGGDREDGPTAVEYAVMLALIIVVCITAITALGTNASNTFSYVGSKTGSVGS